MSHQLEELKGYLERVIPLIPQEVQEDERINSFINNISQLASLINEDFPRAEEVETWRNLSFSRKRGIVPLLYDSIGKLKSKEDKRALGLEVKLIEARLKEILQELEARLAQVKPAEEVLDPTLPGVDVICGRLNPTRQALYRIVDIFSSLGFDVYEGPEVEYEKYNFDLLNIPPYHPARDDVDTFYLAEGIVLRTHTSPVQIRVMERIKERGEVIVQMISPGRAFRRDRPDATHTPIFHQVEGLQVGKGISMANMRWILNEFARRFFGERTRTRLRPDYFPFVEPGAELAASCPFCDGLGCKVCKMSGWIEVLGCGMVHPQVLRNVGIDPDVYSGWAFGIGVERLALLLYQVSDIRLFFQNDLRFLRQF